MQGWTHTLTIWNGCRLLSLHPSSGIVDLQILGNNNGSFISLFPFQQTKKSLEVAFTRPAANLELRSQEMHLLVLKRNWVSCPALFLLQFAVTWKSIFKFSSYLDFASLDDGGVKLIPGTVGVCAVGEGDKAEALIMQQTHALIINPSNNSLLRKIPHFSFSTLEKPSTFCQKNQNNEASDIVGRYTIRQPGWLDSFQTHKPDLCRKMQSLTLKTKQKRVMPDPFFFNYQSFQMHMTRFYVRWHTPRGVRLLHNLKSEPKAGCSWVDVCTLFVEKNDLKWISWPHLWSSLVKDDLHIKDCTKFLKWKKKANQSQKLLFFVLLSIQLHKRQVIKELPNPFSFLCWPLPTLGNHVNRELQLN